MSDSRLEKFIYAICSMDVSDLPVPLSRIEKLWNCLITGETPDFEPLSRNEKYLMAMLDRYDISNLPAPMSRGEKLLYKIAVGETDLSDVPGYSSRYEELLKYLIENGGISGDDFEYVLHTLNQSLNTLYLTAEKPVKSAILKGQTLVNLFDGEKMSLNEPIHYTYSNGIIESTGDGQPWSSKTNMSSAIKPMTKYLLKVKNVGKCSLNVEIRTDLSTLLHIQAVSVGQEVIKIIKTGEKIDGLYVKVYPQVNDNSLLAQAKVNIIEYQYGMENWDIPYFEGMQSVKMPVLTTTGKNLFDVNKGFTTVWQCSYTIGSDGSITIKPTSTSGVSYIATETIELEVGKTYRLTWNETGNTRTSYMWLERTTNGGVYNINKPFTVQEGKNRVRLAMYVDNTSLNNTVTFKPLLEQGTSATTYEPYKSNILSTPSDLELRKVGDVEDELDCSTGEVTQRIGEVVLDGSEEWLISGSTRPNYLRAYCQNKSIKQYQNVINDKFADNGNMNGKDIEGIYMSNTIDIQVEHSRLTEVSINGLKQWLGENNIKVQARLSQESIKTVDLTVVDQDNQPTELRTFDNTTHVLLNSEGLIPTAVLTVRTKIPSASSTSLLMDDISTNQQQLETTVDEQSENVDATMVATTEIFEETL